MSSNRIDIINKAPRKRMQAQQFYSGFKLAHDTYNSISAASNGKIYYILSSQALEKGGKMFVYDPNKDEINFIADLTEVCGEKKLKAVPQGKSHVKFYERNNKLFFSTHVGFYELIDGMDRLPANPPPGYQLYPGGHILSYDISNGKFKDLATVPGGEGVVSMTMDRERGHIYGITWPTGRFFHYNLEQDCLKDLGPISAKGEAGTPGKDFRSLCRSLFVDPKEGSVYFSTSEGDIKKYHFESEAVVTLENVDLKLDYFGSYDPTKPGSMGYNWRSIFWHPSEGVAYGVHGNSGYLFRFDPQKSTIEIVKRLTSEPSRKSGLFDQFSYGYLGFELGPDQKTIYYLTGGPVYVDGKRVRGKDEIAKGAAKGLENLHLITYNIPNREYIDHGPIFYQEGGRPTYVNSITIATNGDVYTLGRFEHEGKIIQDLVKIQNPFQAL